MHGARGLGSIYMRVDDGMTDHALFAALYPSLRRFAAVTAPSDLEPDDLLQEAVARALRVGPLAELDDVGAYLRRTMVNLASNHRRSQGRRRRAVARLPQPDGDAATYPSDLADLDQVDAESRAVLYLTEVEGWTFAQVANQLGGTEEAARTRASRARRRLRRILETEEHDD